MARSSISLLRVYLRPYHTRLLSLLLLILVGIGLQLFAPQIIRQFLDAAQAGAATRLLVQMGLLFLLVTVLQKGLALAATYLGEDLGWAATNRLRADLTRHCMRLDMGFHKLRTPGELIQRIDGDVTALAEYFSQLIVQVFGNTLLILGILFLLFREDWRFGLIGLAYALLTLGFLRLIQTPTVNIWNGIRQGYAEMFGFLEERFNGTEDIRANGGSAYVLNQYYPMHANIARKRVRATLYGGFTFTSSYMLYILALVVTLGLAGFAYQQGQISIGTVYLMVFYIGLMKSPIKRIRRQIANMQRAMASVKRINEFFQLQPGVQETVSQTLPAAAPSVRFKNVTFAYKDRLPVNGNRSSVNGKPITDYRLPITVYRLPITSIPKCCTTSHSCWKRVTFWACWGARAAAKPR
ncbi:MAG: ABC transporter ATP-binding protein [Chloroflexi bacterium]|nr:ABC transporter ATP-binding protein [Chloroflexota bacterium]